MRNISVVTKVEEPVLFFNWFREYRGPFHQPILLKLHSNHIIIDNLYNMRAPLNQIGFSCLPPFM